MSTWIAADQPPAEPGFYWTRYISRIVTGEHGVKTTYYSQAWLKWDGENWSGDVTDWYRNGGGIE
jgi:hypothetical protein